MCANAIQDIHSTKTASVVMVRDVSGGTSVFDQSLDFRTLFVNCSVVQSKLCILASGHAI